MWFACIENEKGLLNPMLPIGGYTKEQGSEVIDYITMRNFNLEYQPVWYDTIEEADKASDEFALSEI